MRKSFLSLLFCISFFAIQANNIQVTNVTLTGQNTAVNTYQIQFDLSWENSWRTSTFESNYDAAWIFIKYRQDPQTAWSRALITTAGFVAPAGAGIDVSNTSTGAFLFRSSDGIGDVSYTGVELRWNYGAIPDDAILEVCVMAIEMVYIPGGTYSLGDDTSTPQGNFESGNTGSPFSITSENALILGGTVASNLSNNDAVNMFTSDDFNYSTTQNLPADYPKGFDPFYIQKYEMSQGQYVAFLNKITPAGGVERFANQFGANGNTINNNGAPPEVYVTSTPDRPCNYLSWADIAAYADWSGLRPPTELEYEKATRGPRTPAVDELAWGNANAFNANYTVVNAGQPNESLSGVGTGTGNANYASTSTSSGPFRCGIFAASAITPSRQETGASYFGVMEMSGNLWELVISVGSTGGRNFTGNHGNGIISSTGNSTVGGWPSIVSALGTGLKGGSFGSGLDRLRTSDRGYCNLEVDTRYSDVGGRLVSSDF